MEKKKEVERDAPYAASSEHAEAISSASQDSDDLQNNSPLSSFDTRESSPFQSEVKTFLSWTAPGRPFRKKGREFFLSVALIVFLIEVILMLFADYSLMLTVGALTFLLIVLSTVAPSDFHYRISSQGIKVEDHFYLWQELYDFYFKKIEGMDTLVIRTQALIPGELKISLGLISRDHARQIVMHFLPYREIVRPDFMEKSADWLSRTFPLEKQAPKHI